MPNGIIQPEFIERLDYMGNWLKIYGESIYNTKGGFIRPQDWGCVTQKDGKVFVHVLKKDLNAIDLLNFPFKTITKSYYLKDKSAIKTQLQNNNLHVSFSPLTNIEEDEVIVLETK